MEENLGFDQSVGSGLERTAGAGSSLELSACDRELELAGRLSHMTSCGDCRAATDGDNQDRQDWLTPFGKAWLVSTGVATRTAT
jgi:hypothetical protein